MRAINLQADRDDYESATPIPRLVPETLVDQDLLTAYVLAALNSPETPDLRWTADGNWGEDGTLPVALRIPGAAEGDPLGDLLPGRTLRGRAWAVQARPARNGIEVHWATDASPWSRAQSNTAGYAPVYRDG